MHLAPRREVWEHGFLPMHTLCPLLESPATLQQLHTKLVEGSKINSAGQLLISSQDAATVLELTSSQAEVLFEVLGALSLRSATTAERPGPGSDLQVHELSLFLFTQLFSKESQRPDSQEVWVDAATPSSTSALMMDGMLSPTRSLGVLSSVRTSVPGKTMLRQQLQQHLKQHAHLVRSFGDYLRRNLNILVELVAISANRQKIPTTVTAAQLDGLQFLMNVPMARQGTPISSLVHGLAAGPLPCDVAAAALRQLWQDDVLLESPRVGSQSPGATFSTSVPRVSRQPGLVGPSGQVDDSSITGVHKGTVVRGEGDVPSGWLRISDCHDTVLYLLAPLQCVHISNCSECTIVVGAAGMLTRLERCDRINLIVATTRLIVSSCHDCQLFLGTARQPVLMGDCRYIRLAPFNTRYERQMAHLKAAGMRLDLPNRWDSPLVLQANRRHTSLSGTPDSPRASPGPKSLGLGASLVSAPSTTFILLPPEEFLPYVVPFQGAVGPLAGGPAPSSSTAWRHMGPQVSRSSATGNSPQGPTTLMYLFPLPAEYERSLHKKLACTSDLRAKLKQAGLGKEREGELNNTIQAYFKDWLSSSGSMRQIYDLSNLEKADEAGEHFLASLPPGSSLQPGLRDKVSLTL